ncbi:pyroglutamyl-peptidase I family protein [Halomicrococcus gelatinilyticus]|uniref:pyroglutamyl-peptidase I family protein n=1 Tax=Halomicrococcus gelatinilyticus TaxID=1702103 RepID=UPI002E0E96C5
MTLLLTGYEPFGEHETNPTERVAQELDGETVAGHDVVGRVLPVEFDAAGDRMRDLLGDHVPAAVLATGLAAGRAGVSVERVGVNVADAGSVPDNADAQPHHERVHEGGDAAYFATVPVVAITRELLADDVPARVSNSAGTHLCNDLLYETRAYLDGTGRDVPAGFVHLPCTPEQAARKAREADGDAGALRPSLPLSTQVAAVRTAFEVTLADERHDGRR